MGHVSHAELVGSAGVAGAAASGAELGLGRRAMFAPIAVAAALGGCASAPTVSGPSLAAVPASTPTSGAAAATQVDRIADAYLTAVLKRRPLLGYFIDRPPERHDQLADNSSTALTAWYAVEDALLARVRAVDPTLLEGRPQWITFGALKERLEASVQQRICRSHLWSVSQMRGWHLRMPDAAKLQPTETAAEREQALSRWRKLPAYIDTEVRLLKRGLQEGYSATRSVVRRVIAQLDGYLALPIDADPFFGIAERTDDPRMKAGFRALVADEIRPAVIRYRDFLRDTYLPRARASLSITANKDGRACYEAMLRGYTTLKRSPEEVFALGQKAVAANRVAVQERGRALFGTGDYAEILEHVKTYPQDAFDGREAIIAFARARVEAARAAMAAFFERLPEDEAVVEPYPPHLDGTGVSSRYEAPKGDGPGTYRIAVNDPKQSRRGREEIVAYHETYPGHHLQIAFAQRLTGVHPVSRVTRNAAFIEGWARYSEALAEEAGLYESPTGPIYRRTWPARGMVVDPGIHVMGWDREQAVAFIRASGRFDRTAADRMVDRIATIPGQLTSYDSGALEIFALRKMAEDALGGRFDIKAFHLTVLENGTVPLWMLRAHVTRWVRAQSS